jgi:3,4-dihydroxy 2-butanone 4-phosphate synthase/GTP cyclohydrolase II
MFLGIPDAAEQLQAGKTLIVVDDENRENEGDLVAAAQTITPQQVNFITAKARGLLCVALEESWAQRLQLWPMTNQNTALHQTNFTVTVDAKEGTTTGISAFDRAATIRRLADPEARPEDFARPGHISPIVARRGGVFCREGHTEATVDLLRIAGVAPVGVLCEILDGDGTTARLPALERLADEYRIGIVRIDDLIEYRRHTEPLVERVLATQLPTPLGMFELHLYLSKLDHKEHLALVCGDVASSEPVLVRVHDQCLTGDLFRSLRCDCGPQLRRALQRIQAEGRGVLLYLAQEGRGIGLVDKLRAYVLQDQGCDTIEANLKLGRNVDDRDYHVAGQILEDLGVRKIRLMTNNPRKVRDLAHFGLQVVERVPICVRANHFNSRYLKTKREKLGHMI